MLEGGEGNPFEEKTMRHSPVLTGDEYIRLLADLAENIGGNTIVSAGTRYGLEVNHNSSTKLLLYIYKM